MLVNKKRESDTSLLARLRNEFLFAREFEYESPLTPAELSAALKAIENLDHSAWVLSFVSLKHKLETVIHSDKASDFKITLHEDKKATWSSRMNIQFIEGTITADAHSGLSIIKGKTYFSGQYYAMWLFIFAANIFSQLSGGMGFMGWFWLGMGIIYWLAMYRERNALADRLDTIIMHAKSANSLAILDGESHEDLTQAETLVEYQRNSAKS